MKKICQTFMWISWSFSGESSRIRARRAWLKSRTWQLFRSPKVYKLRKEYIMSVEEIWKILWRAVQWKFQCTRHTCWCMLSTSFLENFLKMSAKKMVVLFLLSILSFFGCYCVTPVPEESDRGHTITAKKPTTSTNSHQRTQEYIKGKSPSFIS